MGPEMMGEAYQAYSGQNHGSNFTYIDRMQQQKNVEEAEEMDINASLHGNWTMENAKSKLHQFLQINKINTDYMYKAVGPDHTRLVNCFSLSTVLISFYIIKIKKTCSSLLIC